MGDPTSPSCPVCGGRLVVEMDPASPPDAGAQALLADPPFHHVCTSPDCSRGSSSRP